MDADLRSSDVVGTEVMSHFLLFRFSVPRPVTVPGTFCQGSAEVVAIACFQDAA